LQNQVASESVIIGVVQAEKLKVSDAEVTKAAETYAKQYELASAEELYKQIPKKAIENDLLSKKALEFITENAVVTTIDESSKS
jgi:FKBP-type peptidyl-prolyl cis-trans isomerase (trigger factor)